MNREFLEHYNRELKILYERSSDFAAEFPNRAIPHDQFPANAWQPADEYLSKFLPQAIALVQRAQEAILAEYGQPKKGDWETRTEMFHVYKYDTLDEEANAMADDTIRGKLESVMTFLAEALQHYCETGKMLE